MTTANLGNLTRARRLARPALGRGRVQVLARRALRALGEASTSEIMRWVYCRKYLRGERLANHDNRSTRRALDRIANRVGRASKIGRPWVWKLRDPGV
jgi:hypothetical protein